LHGGLNGHRRAHRDNDERRAGDEDWHSDGHHPESRVNIRARAHIE
jgi:hypothetical protein